MSEREALGSAQALALGGELGDSGQRGAHSRSVTVTDGRKVASEIRYKASDAGDRQYTKSKFTGTSSVRAIALASQHWMPCYMYGCLGHPVLFAPPPPAELENKL